LAAILRTSKRTDPAAESVEEIDEERAACEGRAVVEGKGLVGDEEVRVVSALVAEMRSVNIRPSTKSEWDVQ
jgi:hypothetical protein